MRVKRRRGGDDSGWVNNNREEGATEFELRMMARPRCLWKERWSLVCWP
jgi:hypothetical protein